MCIYVPLTVSFAIVCMPAQDGKTDAVKEDLKRLQGTWKVVSGTDSGKPMPKELLKKLKTLQLVIEGNKFIIKSTEGSQEGLFKIDPGTYPKRFEIVEGFGTNTPGIYRVERDTLMIWWVNPDERRPGDFKSALVLQRQKTGKCGR
jgi:uncharacterized protein (TIGR03067 family)